MLTTSSPVEAVSRSGKSVTIGATGRCGSTARLSFTPNASRVVNCTRITVGVIVCKRISPAVVVTVTLSSPVEWFSTSISILLWRCFIRSACAARFLVDVEGG